MVVYLFRAFRGGKDGEIPWREAKLQELLGEAVLGLEDGERIVLRFQYIGLEAEPIEAAVQSLRAEA